MPAKATSATSEPSGAAQLAKPDIKFINVPIVSLSSLIMHAWSEKAMKMMLDKQTKRARVGREAKDPEADYLASMYVITGNPGSEEAVYGYPATAFKNAMVRAGTYTEDKMTFLRGAFYVNGIESRDMVTIHGTPQPREDMVRVGMGTADIRYRAEFPVWNAKLHVEFNARAISTEQIINLAQVAGFSVGVGDWRPEKDGDHGRFRVDA